MRVLLDTHAFLWWVEDAPTLTKRAKTVLSESGERMFAQLGELLGNGDQDQSWQVATTGFDRAIHS